MKKLIIFAFLICSCLAWFSTPVSAKTKRLELAGDKNSDTENKSDKVVNILADNLEQIASENKIIGTGNVKIKHMTMRIAADKIELNTKTGLGTARGNVVLMDETRGHKVHSPFVVFNFNSQLATLYDSEGTMAKDYFFHGKKVERKSEDHYVINEGDITPCTGPFPAWKFKCSKVDARMGDYAILHNPTFLIRDTPLFSLPYGYVPLNFKKRSSGFLLPLIGSSNEDGTFFSDAFFWAINEQWDATFGLDYLSKRGVRPSAEVRYYTSETTKGSIYGDILRDRETDVTYWKILLDHKQRLPYGVEMTTNFDWQEGSDYGKIHSNSVGERTRRETDSYLALTKNWNSRTLFFESRYHRSLENSNGRESGILPQISFRNQLQRIRNTPLYFELDTSYSNFSHKAGNEVGIRLTQRFDVHPQLSLPINNWPWLTVTPRIGVRETIYDNGIKNASNDYDEFLFRTVYNFNTTVDGPSFAKLFYGKGGKTAYKHLIEPRVTYNYVPDVGKIRRKVVVSDSIDTIDESNIVTYSLTNRLFEKMLGGQSLNTQERIRFDVSQSYDFNKADKRLDARPFSQIRFDFDSRLSEKLMLNVDATYSIYEDWITTLNVETVVKPWDNLGFYLERRYVRRASTDILGTVRWKFARNWELDYSARFDEEKERFRENDVSLFYQAQCWGFGMDVIRRTNYYKGATLEDTRVLFHISLKGLGTYSTGKGDGIHKRF